MPKEAKNRTGPDFQALVEEAETAGFGLLLKLAGRPAVGVSGLHVGHGPNDLSRVVFKHFGTEADVGPARR